MESFQKKALGSLEDFCSVWFEAYRKNIRFLDAVFQVPKPSWSTENQIVLDLESVLLRDFSRKKGDPVLVLPPMAGHHSSIADFSKEQSLVKTFLDNGFSEAYATEWKSATLERKNETIEDFITATDNCVDKIGKDVILVGICQGGWQAAIYAALFPEKVRSLVLGGAPIDFHGEDGLVNLYARMLPMSFYEHLVAMGGGVMKGSFLLAGFKNMQPFEQYCTKYLELYNSIGDDEYVERFKGFHNWYEYTQDLPGKFYLEVVKDLFKGNKLVKGELEILGRKVDLGNIGCPLHLIAGSEDHITLPGQLFNIEKYAISNVIEKTIVPSGHIGLFMGKKALQDYWPDISKSVKQNL